MRDVEGGMQDGNPRGNRPRYRLGEQHRIKDLISHYANDLLASGNYIHYRAGLLPGSPGITQCF